MFKPAAAMCHIVLLEFVLLNKERKVLVHLVYEEDGIASSFC